jgi:hypothetical protein
MEQTTRVQEKRASGLRRLISNGPFIAAVLMLYFSLGMAFWGVMAHPAAGQGNQKIPRQVAQTVYKSHNARFFHLNVLRIKANAIAYYPPIPWLICQTDPSASHAEIYIKTNQQINLGAEWLVGLPPKKDITPEDIAYWGSGQHKFNMQLKAYYERVDTTNFPCNVSIIINTPKFTAEDLASLAPDEQISFSWVGPVCILHPGNGDVGKILDVDTSIFPINWQTAQGSESFYQKPHLHIVDKNYISVTEAKPVALPSNIRAPIKH